MTDLVDLYRRAHKEFDAQVAAVQDDQWSAPTPCSAWDVRTLVNHIVNENRWTPPLMRGVEEVGDRFDGDLLGDDPKAAWDEAFHEAQAAVQEEGALERTVHVSFGDIPAREYISQMVIEHVVHGWDLARAVETDERIDPDLVDYVYEAGKPFTEQFRPYGAFRDIVAVPEDADIQTKLLAMFGRNP